MRKSVILLRRDKSDHLHEFVSETMHTLERRKFRKGAAHVKDYMLERVTAIAAYILDTGSTVRTCAEHFKVSKTTVHKDVTQRLRKHDPALHSQVRRVLDENKAQRHIRGGLATRDKYRRRKGGSAGLDM